MWFFWSQTYFLCLTIHAKKLLPQTRWKSDVPRIFIAINKFCHYLPLWRIWHHGDVTLILVVFILVDMDRGGLYICIKYSIIWPLDQKKKKKKEHLWEIGTTILVRYVTKNNSLNSRDLFLNLRRLVKMTKLFWDLK